MAKKIVVEPKGKDRSKMRAQRNRDKQALQRIHGKIQAKPVPPKHGDYTNIHEGYTCSVVWSGDHTNHQSREGRPASRLITVLVYDNNNANRRIGSCTFLYQEEGAGRFGRKQLARFVSRGISYSS